MCVVILGCVSLLVGLSRLTAGTQEPAECIILTAMADNVSLGEESAETSGALLQPVEVNSKLDFSTVVSFVSRVFPSPGYYSAGMHKGGGNLTNCSKVIGVVGDLGARTARIIHTLASRSNLSIILVASVAPSTFLPVSNLALPNVLDLRPLSHYIEALVGFFDRLNWTRVGLITDNTYYYQFAAELLQKRLLADPKNTVIPFVHITDNVILPVFREYETRIVVILMDKQTTCLILQEAQKLSFKWPEYSLIAFDYEINDSTRFCDIAHYEALIVINERASASSPETGGPHYSTKPELARLFAVTSNFSLPSRNDSVKFTLR